MLAVPLNGSLDSLVKRHRSTRTRFRQVEAGQLFAQPTRPRFRQVVYDSPPRRLLFDLVDAGGERSSWRLDRIVPFTEAIRNKAAKRLKDACNGQDGRSP